MFRRAARVNRRGIGVQGGGASAPAPEAPILTSPAAAGTYYVGESLPATATTSDTDVTMTWIAYPDGQTADGVDAVTLATDASSPYSQPIAMPDGLGVWHMIARAEGPGGTTDSAPIDFTLGRLELRVDTYVNVSTNWTSPNERFFHTDGTENAVDVYGVGSGAGGTTATGGGGGGASSRLKDTGLALNTAYALVAPAGGAVTANGADATWRSTVLVAKGGLNAAGGGLGGTAAASTGDTKFSGGNAVLGAGSVAGGGGAGDTSSASGLFPGAVLGGRAGSSGASNSAALGAGGGSSAAAQVVGRRGEIRVSYFVIQTDARPVCFSRAFGRDTADGTTRNVTLPVGTGGRLLVLAVSDGASVSIGMGGDWTSVATATDAAQVSIAAFEQVATGAETVALTTGASQQVDWCVQRWHNAGPFEASAGATGASVSPDSASLTFAAAGKHQVISFIGTDSDAFLDLTAIPAGFGRFEWVPPYQTTGVMLAWSSLFVDGASSNPGAYTLAFTEQWAALTLATPFLALSGAAEPAAPPAEPASFTNNVLWLDSDRVSRGFLGDGTLVTAAQNRGTEADTIALASAGAPTWFAGRYNGGSCMRFGGAEALKVAGGAIAALVHGKTAAQLDLTIVLSWQTRHSDAIIACGWGLDGGATDEGLVINTATDGYKPRVTGGTDAGAQSAVTAPDFIEHLVPACTIIRISGGNVTVRHDGVNQTPQAIAWSGTFDVDTFGIGCVETTGEALGAEFYLTDLVVQSGSRSDGDCTLIEQYIGERRGFKHKLVDGTGEDWLVVGFIGASNCIGFGSVTHTGYAIEADADAYYMALDGFAKPLVMNTGDGVNKAAPDLAFASPSYSSMIESLRKQMRVNGETRRLLFVPCALDSTDSNAWNTGLTTDPPSVTNLTGHMKHRIRDALKAPGASLLFVYDGAASNCQSAGEVTDWTADWGANYDEYNTFFAGKFDLDHHFLIGRLAANLPAGVGANIADMRTAELALEAARSDVVLVQSPDGHDALGGADAPHLTGTEQQAYGVVVADGIDGTT